MSGCNTTTHYYGALQEVCYQYWPGKRAQNYGEFRVELLSEEKNTGFIVRNFSVQQAKASLTIQDYRYTHQLSPRLYMYTYMRQLAYLYQTSIMCNKYMLLCHTISVIYFYDHALDTHSIICCKCCFQIAVQYSTPGVAVTNPSLDLRLPV